MEMTVEEFTVVLLVMLWVYMCGLTMWTHRKLKNAWEEYR
jgi:hypothetical protein